MMMRTRRMPQDPATIGAEARGNGGYRPILGLLPVTINRPPAQVNMQSMN